MSPLLCPKYDEERVAYYANYPGGGTPYDGLGGKVYLFQAWGTWKARKFNV